ncbi:thermonuclease family protein [Candidatus Uhrbacteria bacterium]|nr:thermonuclease family protein [Candidatus Uhrbacteria bacterium]
MFIRLRSSAGTLLFFVLILGACRPVTGTKVLRAVDGDTLKVQLADGKTETIRIIGINTPETVDPRKSVQCYGPEASARMHALADGKGIVLETGSGDDHDDYGRLLRYVSINGRDLGATMIAEGYSRNYSFFPHPRMDAYAELERTAKENGAGLWSACPHRSVAPSAFHFSSETFAHG